VIKKEETAALREFLSNLKQEKNARIIKPDFEDSASSGKVNIYCEGKNSLFFNEKKNFNVKPVGKMTNKLLN